MWSRRVSSSCILYDIAVLLISKSGNSLDGHRGKKKIYTLKGKIHCHLRSVYFVTINLFVLRFKRSNHVVLKFTLCT